MKTSEWLAQNNISKDKYYYWQRKVKDACLESMQMEQTTFVELPVEVPQVNAHMPVIKKAANNLKPYEYFDYLLTELPEHLDDKDRGFIDNLLPWSPNLPEHIRKVKRS